jgi:hypothetical protein
MANSLGGITSSQEPVFYFFSKDKCQLLIYLDKSNLCVLSAKSHLFFIIDEICASDWQIANKF